VNSNQTEADIVDRRKYVSAMIAFNTHARLSALCSTQTWLRANRNKIKRSDKRRGQFHTKDRDRKEMVLEGLSFLKTFVSVPLTEILESIQVRDNDLLAEMPCFDNRVHLE
jgi:hypothetical protein